MGETRQRQQRQSQRVQLDTEDCERFSCSRCGGTKFQVYMEFYAILVLMEPAFQAHPAVVDMQGRRAIVATFTKCLNDSCGKVQQGDMVLTDSINASRPRIVSGAADPTDCRTVG